jgi:hypothetical protein
MRILASLALNRFFLTLPCVGIALHQKAGGPRRWVWLELAIHECASLSPFYGRQHISTS